MCGWLGAVPVEGGSEVQSMGQFKEGIIGVGRACGCYYLQSGCECKEVVLRPLY